jgi:Holliday junction resolvase RusA-like endonuclease
MIRAPKDIRFTVYGTAKGKAMPFVVRNKKTGKTHAIPPSREWEDTVTGQALQYRPERPIEGPVALGLLFYRPMTKAILNNKTLREQALAREYLPTTKPDLKNVTASIEDAFKGLFWIDDAQVIQYIDVDGIPYGKYYGESPRIEILIRPLPYCVRGKRRRS